MTKFISFNEDKKIKRECNIKCVSCKKTTHFYDRIKQKERGNKNESKK